ncbi:uncharacterized protein C2845_PM07G01270 [Panicum miliaceum]|uniref:Uncharacterized protein n=1 Tax=Panicum miliaceum TaxID=4540 RepID=A0A3L6SS52_PANMI|nr:uncharacterized protein C2845_PM07G01270 [Panicum miliaceum]
MATPTTTPPRMKLLIDTESQRVLFAEASKEAVDILLSLLALPVATLVEPDLGRRGAGSVGNLYASAEKLGYAYVQPGAAEDELPRPISSLLLMPASRTFFRCHHNYRYCGNRASKSCGSYMTDVRGTRCCPNCADEMTATLHLVSPARSGLANPSQILPQSTSSSEGSAAAAAAEAATYTVLDDLTITPHAPMSAISSVAKLGALTSPRSRRGPWGSATPSMHGWIPVQGLGILKASLHSKTVLNDVFLGDWTSSFLPLVKKKGNNEEENKGSKGKTKKKKLVRLPPDLVEALINYKCTPFPKQAGLPAHLVENHRELCDDLTTALSAAEVVARRCDDRIAMLQDKMRHEFETKGYIEFEATDDEAEDDIVSAMALQQGSRGGGRGGHRPGVMKRAKGSRK